MIDQLFNMQYLRKRVNDINYRTRRFINRRNSQLAALGLPLLPIETITADDYIHVYMENHGACGWCGQQMHDDHVDHIMPLSKNGRNTRDNITVCCAKCNRRKYSKHPAKFVHELYDRTHVKTSPMRVVEAKYAIVLAYRMSYIAPATIIDFNVDNDQQQQSA